MSYLQFSIELICKLKLIELYIWFGSNFSYALLLRQIHDYTLNYDCLNLEMWFHFVSLILCSIITNIFCFPFTFCLLVVCALLAIDDCRSERCFSRMFYFCISFVALQYNKTVRLIDMFSLQIEFIDRDRPFLLFSFWILSRQYTNHDNQFLWTIFVPLHKSMWMNPKLCDLIALTWK